MPEVYLTKSGFTYNACGPFNKSQKKKNQNSKETRWIIKTNKIKLISNLIWLRKTLKIYLEEQIKR